MISWVMTNSLKGCKLAEKYFRKLKDLETYIIKENIKKIQDDFSRSECTCTTGRGGIDTSDSANNRSVGKQKKW